MDGAGDSSPKCKVFESMHRLTVLVGIPVQGRSSCLAWRPLPRLSGLLCEHRRANLGARMI